MAKPHAQLGYTCRSYKIVHAADISGICLVIAIINGSNDYLPQKSSAYCNKYLLDNLSFQARYLKAPRRLSGRFKGVMEIVKRI